MQILLCSATSFEINPLIRLKENPGYENVQVLITGVGMLNTAYHLTRSICLSPPSLVILAGIGGSFEANMEGRTFIIQEDLPADLGVEENGEWKDLASLGLQDNNQFPFRDGLLVNPVNWKHLEIDYARGCTINEISSNPSRIRKIRDKYHPDVESMEGAAIHYICLQEGIPFLHLRSVSNEVGERDKRKWKMELAIKNLNDALIKVIRQVNQPQK